MFSKQDKVTITDNGHVVMEALQNIDKIPTLTNLAQYISSIYEINEKKVKKPLKQVLESGIDLGLFTRQNGKYYLYGEESSSTSDNESENDIADAYADGRRTRIKSTIKTSRSGMSVKSSGRSRSRSPSSSKSPSKKRKRRPSKST